MPYNPDDLMVQCEGCKDWYGVLCIFEFLVPMGGPIIFKISIGSYYCSYRYHPACVDMTIEEAKMLDHFVCSECSEDDLKRSQNGFHPSPVSDVKVRPFSDQILMMLGELSFSFFFEQFSIY